MTIVYWLILALILIGSVLLAAFSYRQGTHVSDLEVESLHMRLTEATALLEQAGHDREDITQKLEEVTRERDAARIQRDAQRPPLPPKRPIGKKREVTS